MTSTRSDKRHAPVLYTSYMLMRRSLYLVPFLVFLVWGTQAMAVENPCPDGAQPHTATADEVAAGYPAGSLVCPGDQKVIPADSGAAKQYLKTIATGRAASASWRIDELNPAFAICAARFLRFANDNGLNARITDAVRTYGEQQGACGRYQAGGGIANCDMATAEHPKGIAIDSTSGNQPWMWANAPQFGLVYYLGSRDSVHFVALTQSSYAKLARNAPNATVMAQAQQNLSRGGGCLTPGFTPSSVGTPGDGSGLPFDGALRRTLGVPPPPPPPSYQSQPLQSLQQNPSTQTQSQQSAPALDTLNTTAYPAGTCAPQTRCSEQDGNIYYRTSTCIDQKYLTCTNGCSGLTCNATSTGSGSSGLFDLLNPATSSQSTNTGGSGTSNSTSTFDLIDFFANPLSVVDVGTSTPIDITNLIEDTGNASVLHPNTPPQGTVIQTPPQGSAYGPVPQQTFTSGDLANTPGVVVAQNTFAQNILAQMRATLLGVLVYLRPFGGVAPAQAGFIE